MRELDSMRSSNCRNVDGVAPLVSIVMPAYNCEPYVADAMDSIIAQTYHNWELLIADDGSSDGTRRIIDRYEDPRIKRFHNDHNIGLVKSWNKLLSYASGAFVAWQDADDISSPNRLQVLVDFMCTNTDVMLCGSSGVRHIGLTGERQQLTYPLTDEAIRASITQERIFPFLGPTRMIRREVLREVKGFREFFDGLGGEDIDFVLRITERFSVANVPDVLYMYRYTRGSNSRKRATDKTYLKLYIQQIAFFLAEQRQRNRGLDGLMDSGNEAELNAFVEGLKSLYERDKSVVYRRATLTSLNGRDYTAALINMAYSLLSGPLVAANHALALCFMRSFIMASVRAIFHRRHSSKSISLWEFN